MNNRERFQDLIQQSTVFINGKPTPAKDAKISVFDRGFLYGDSIYEVCYTENKKLVFFEEHLQRLKKSADLLGIELFISIEEIKQQVLQTIQAADLQDAYIRIVLTRGESIISLDPATSFKNNLVTIAKPVPVYPSEYYTRGIKLHLSSVVRNNIKSVDPNAKSGNYLNNVLALDEAKKMGADEALMLNKSGEITEGSSFNFWIVKGQQILTPPGSSGLLEGITRKKILELSQNSEFDIKESTLTTSDLDEANEAFITSSTRKIIPVSSIGKVQFGNDISQWPVTQKLMQSFEELRQKNLQD